MQLFKINRKKHQYVNLGNICLLIAEAALCIDNHPTICNANRRDGGQAWSYSQGKKYDTLNCVRIKISSPRLPSLVSQYTTSLRVPRRLI